jgi:RimJ/RimL family protein N-acetyltransferase
VSPPVLDRARLEGEVVILRPIDVTDIDAAFEQIHGRREILDWLIWQGPESRLDLEPYYSAWKSGGSDGYDYHFALVGRDDGRFAGSIGARFRGHPRTGDLGYWIATDRWGRGYASEAIRLLTWLCFARLQSVLTYANVFVGNEASRRALEKSGYAHDHTTKAVYDGVQREQWHMSLSHRGFLRAFEGWEPVAAEVELSEAN